MSNEFRLRCNAHGVRDRPFVLSRYFLLRLLGRREVVLNLHCRDAEFSRCSEAQAATAIQSHWRAFIVRKNVKHLANACCVIQSGFRGFRGRKRACQLQAQVGLTAPLAKSVIHMIVVNTGLGDLPGRIFLSSRT